NILAGNVTCKFLYGAPDTKYARRYTLRARVNITIASEDGDRFSGGMTDEIVEETDEPYAG
ncbi:MAG TPA: hypothetical protein VIG74_05290, partial [Alphaproteobacteria bacterium]